MALGVQDQFQDLAKANPGGLRPDRRAPGDFAEEGAFQFFYCFL